MKRLAGGVIAGAVGTLALNAATYADMAIRGRAGSTVPDETIERTARRLGADAIGGVDETARNRRQALGALSGYAVGLTVGAAYGVLRPSRPFPAIAEALVVGAVAMSGGNAGAIAAGTTDPRRWTIGDWLADLVPHVCFGLATVATRRALAGEKGA